MYVEKKHQNSVMRKLLLITCGFLALSLSNCSESIPEVKETIHSAEDNSMAETHFMAMFDAAFDFIATDGKFKKKSGPTIVPSEKVTVTYKDSSFNDGDGIEVEVDFGPLDNPGEQKGILCQDGRYRAGKLNISVNQSVNSADFKATVRIDKGHKYYSGDGVNMTQLSGRMVIRFVEPLIIGVKIEKAEVSNDEVEVEWESELTIIGQFEAGPGIWGDTYTIMGRSSGTNRDGESYTTVIEEPLIKKMENDCATTFVDGKITLSSSESSQVISIDYDPFENQECDRFAEASINGRKTIFEIQ